MSIGEITRPRKPRKRVHSATATEKRPRKKDESQRRLMKSIIQAEEESLRRTLWELERVLLVDRKTDVSASQRRKRKLKIEAIVLLVIAVCIGLIVCLAIVGGG